MTSEGLWTLDLRLYGLLNLLVYKSQPPGLQDLLGFKLQVERISVAIVHLYCTFCEQNKVYIWTQEENLSKKSG